MRTNMARDRGAMLNLDRPFPRKPARRKDDSTCCYAFRLAMRRVRQLRRDRNEAWREISRLRAELAALRAST